MRHIVIMRGAQGAGKSTFISKQGLDAFVLSPDRLRLQMGGLIMQPDGRFAVNSLYDRKVWEEVERLTEAKMARGEFIVLDATFQSPRDFKTPLSQAQRFGYAVTCVDFSHVPIEVAKHNNRQRPMHFQVPDEAIDRAYERFGSARLPDGMRVVRPEDFAETRLIDALAWPMLDLNEYTKVHHIGDIQGCYAPVAEYFREGLRDDEFYTFVGDFLDRGIQNGEVIRFVVDTLLPRDNVALIYGNHEYHIARFALGQEPVSKEFANATLPQLEAANFTRGEAHRLVNRLRDAVTYRYGSHRVLVTHAGLARVPDDMVLLPAIQCWKGTGSYDDPVDAVFSRTMAGTDWIQVHGHRNSKRLPMRAGAQSFNLESEVEFGGDLSIVTLDRDGVFDEIRIANTVFARAKDTSGAKANDPSLMSEATLNGLKAHDFVAEKRFVSAPHIRSYNFTPKAFYKGAWDKVTMSARGLFVDDDRRIVARAYDKFFNLEERAETEMRNLKQTLAFPLTLYVKENGFLGLLGYDAANDVLFFASKSTPDSEFAGWFREILTAQVGEAGLETLRVRLRDDNLSLVFEVNDPVRDPHMIEYATPHVVLLDAVRRTEAFTRLGLDDLRVLAAELGIAVKQTGMVFHDWDDFAAWYADVKAQGLDYRHDGRDIEGYVIEDARGFMFKVKLPYYAFWKMMRSLKDRILTARRNGGDIRRDNIIALTGDDGQAFFDWASTQGDDVLAQDIISLRKLYLATVLA